MSILIVEDDDVLRDGLVILLRDMDLPILTAATAAAGLEAARRHPVDLIVLDVRLPDRSGLDLLEELRLIPRLRTTPIMALTSVSDIDAKERAFERGATDYLCKPFETRELLARLKAMLRRQPGSERRRMTIGESLEYDAVDHVLLAGGQEIFLTANEDKLFRSLLTEVDRPVSKERLVESVWRGRSVGERSIDTLVSFVRKKIAGTGLEIRTILGVGYQLSQGQSPPTGASAKISQ